MFDGKMKALTFSYDDGVTQDQRLIALLNKYGLKCTFNLNSDLLGQPGSLVREDVTVAHTKPRACEVAKIYAGHEVAAHTLTHPVLKNLSDEEIVRQVEEDRLALSQLVGYEVVGMAYPGGDHCLDERVYRLVGEKTGIRYARRTTDAPDPFAPQSDLIQFLPSVYHHAEWDRMFALGEQFLAMQPDSPKIFYVWGHAYEFDIHNTWDRFEEFCRMMAGHDDIFYGTNAQVLLAKH